MSIGADGTVHHPSYGAARPVSLYGAQYRKILASFLPALLFAYILIAFPLIYNTPDTGTGAASAPDFFLNELVFPALFLMALGLFLADRPIFRFWRKPPIMVLAAYCGFCGLSISWALAPEISFDKFALLLLALGLPSLSILVAGSLESCLKPMFWVMAATMAINLAAVVLMPAGPIGHEGIYPHKNLLGVYAALGAIFGLGGLCSRSSFKKFVGLVMIVSACVILTASDSQTSLLLTLIIPLTASVMFVVRRNLRIALPVQVLLLLAGVLFCLYVLGMTHGVGIGTISMMVSGEPTFTGRTDIWEFALSKIAERPLHGYGLRSFWNIGVASPSHGAAPGFLHVTPHAHNGYLDIMLELGWIGLTLLILLIMAVLGVVDRMVRERPGTGYFALCLVCLPVLHNLLESTWFEPLDATMVPFLLIVFMSAVEQRPTEHRHGW